MRLDMMILRVCERTVSIPSGAESTLQARCQRGECLGFEATGFTSRKMRFQVPALVVGQQSIQVESHIFLCLFIRDPVHSLSSFNNTRNRSRAWFKRECTVPTGTPSISAISETGSSW